MTGCVAQWEGEGVEIGNVGDTRLHLRLVNVELV